MVAKDSGSRRSVDIHVGATIRARRKRLDMSQHDLAQQLGLAFQQIQKYETSGNRISASRLYEVSRVLKVPVAYFFAGLDEEQAEDFAVEIDAKMARLFASSEGQEMA